MKWIRLAVRYHAVNAERPATMCGISLHGIDVETTKLDTLTKKPQDYCCDECVESINIDTERTQHA